MCQIFSDIFHFFQHFFQQHFFQQLLPTRHRFAADSVPPHWIFTSYFTHRHYFIKKFCTFNVLAILHSVALLICQICGISKSTTINYKWLKSHKLIGVPLINCVLMLKIALSCISPGDLCVVGVSSKAAIR